jgi:hypothetical protein
VNTAAPWVHQTRGLRGWCCCVAHCVSSPGDTSLFSPQCCCLQRTAQQPMGPTMLTELPAGVAARSLHCTARAPVASRLPSTPPSLTVRPGERRVWNDADAVGRCLQRRRTTRGTACAAAPLPPAPTQVLQPAVVRSHTPCHRIATLTRMTASIAPVEGCARPGSASCPHWAVVSPPLCQTDDRKWLVQ